MREEKIEVGMIRFSSNRTYGGDGEIPILAEDIKLNDLINPITVKLAVDEKDTSIQVYEIVAGRRRFMAVQQLGWKEIPCRILEGDEVNHVEEIAGSENINRLSMHPLDEAAVFKKLLENGKTIEELAKRYDRPASGIWQRIQLLDLTDEVKKMFRDGIISLHSAAMLKSLDAEKQKAFCKQQFRRDYIGGEKGKKMPIEDYEVSRWITGIQNDPLYKSISEECAECKKRTYFTDKTFFPELDEEKDFCMDHDCYVKKMEDVISRKVKALIGRSSGHAAADIIFTESSLVKKIFGRSVKVDDKVYSIRNKTWQIEHDLSDNAGKGAKPVIVFELTNSKASMSAKYWKEPAAKQENEIKQKKESAFGPIMKMLEMPKEEAEKAVSVLTQKCNPNYSWEIKNKADDIERSAKEKVLKRLIENKAKQPDSDKDLDLFLEEFFDHKGNCGNIIKNFTESADVKSLKKLSPKRLYAALYSCCLGVYDMPNINDIGKSKNDGIAEWAGLKLPELKAMYKEELAALMPKTKPAETKEPDKTPEAKKTTAKKPAAKKPQGKGKKK